jgi:hypothetical protein
MPDAPVSPVPDPDEFWARVRTRVEADPVDLPPGFIVGTLQAERASRDERLWETLHG